MPTINEIIDHGRKITIDDGTTWDINFLHSSRITLWHPGQVVHVVPSGKNVFTHILVNTALVVCVEAKPDK